VGVCVCGVCVCVCMCGVCVCVCVVCVCVCVFVKERKAVFPELIRSAYTSFLVSFLVGHVTGVCTVS